MEPTILDDSYARLRWVKLLADQARTALDALEHDSGAAEREDERLNHLAFLIGDMATNAWACLDMAVTQLVEHRGVNLKSPSFPILNKDKLKQIRDSDLPEAWKHAITVLQPEDGEHYLRPNIEALWMRDISNANKHRNLTSALRSRMKYRRDAEDTLTIITETVDGSQEPNERVRPEIFIWDIARFGGTSNVLNARTLIGVIPRFVEHALSVFRYAETDGERGMEPSPSPGADIMFAKMTHPAHSHRYID